MNGYRSTSINVYCVHSVTVSHVSREVHIGMVVQEKLNDIFESIMCSKPKWKLSFLYHVNKSFRERQYCTMIECQWCPGES